MFCILSSSYVFGYYIHGTAVLLTYLTILYSGDPGTGGQGCAVRGEGLSKVVRLAFIFIQINEEPIIISDYINHLKCRSG